MANTSHLPTDQSDPVWDLMVGVKMNPRLLFVCLFNPLLLSKLIVYQSPKLIWLLGGCRYTWVPPDHEPRVGTCPAVVGMGSPDAEAGPWVGFWKWIQLSSDRGPRGFLKTHSSLACFRLESHPVSLSHSGVQ